MRTDAGALAVDTGSTDAGTLEAATAPDGGCDFDGTWGSLITIDVSWAPQGISGFILAAGNGADRGSGSRATRVQSSALSAALSDDSVVCGIVAPGLSRRPMIAGGETYGVRFPDTLFDTEYLPTFTVNGALGESASGVTTYSSTPTAALLGVDDGPPDHRPVARDDRHEVDLDNDGNPGVTVGVAQGAPYIGYPHRDPRRCFSSRKPRERGLPGDPAGDDRERRRARLQSDHRHRRRSLRSRFPPARRSTPSTRTSSAARSPTGETARRAPRRRRARRPASWTTRSPSSLSPAALTFKSIRQDAPRRQLRRRSRRAPLKLDRPSSGTGCAHFADDCSSFWFESNLHQAASSPSCRRRYFSRLVV